MSERIICRVYDMNGVFVKECHIAQEPMVPTHGSISVLVQGQWINFMTSEWLYVSVTPQPDTHETKFRREMAISEAMAAQRNKESNREDRQA